MSKYHDYDDKWGIFGNSDFIILSRGCQKKEKNLLLGDTNQCSDDN